MRLIVCRHCQLALRVIGNVDEVEQLAGTRSEFFPDKFPCPTCRRSCPCYPEIEVDPTSLAVFRVVDVTPVEAYAAFHELGLPLETKCSLEEVNKILLEHPIRKVHGFTIEGTTRCLIEKLELWDGTMVFFGAGGNGAVIYRIVKASTYASRVTT